MRTQNLRTLASVLLVFATVAVFAGPGRAEAPPEKPRWFAQTTSSTYPPAVWQAEGSRRIVAHCDGKPSGAAIEFGVPGDGWYPGDFVVKDGAGNVILDVQGTAWFEIPVVHVTDSGVEKITQVYWLDEAQADADGPDLPDTGVTAKTGPEGQVLTLVEFGITSISGGPNAGKYRVVSNGGWRLSLSFGLFNK